MPGGMREDFIGGGLANADAPLLNCSCSSLREWVCVSIELDLMRMNYFAAANGSRTTEVYNKTPVALHIDEHSELDISYD